MVLNLAYIPTGSGIFAVQVTARGSVPCSFCRLHTNIKRSPTRQQVGLIRIGRPLVAELALGYSIEAYPLLASEVSVAVVLLQNCIGAGLTSAIAPWIEAAGLQNTFVVIYLRS